MSDSDAPPACEGVLDVFTFSEACLRHFSIFGYNVEFPFELAIFIYIFGCLAI